jgi:hypothetical protein
MVLGEGVGQQLGPRKSDTKKSEKVRARRTFSQEQFVRVHAGLTEINKEVRFLLSYSRCRLRPLLLCPPCVTFALRKLLV